MDLPNNQEIPDNCMHGGKELKVPSKSPIHFWKSPNTCLLHIPYYQSLNEYTPYPCIKKKIVTTMELIHENK